MKIIFDYRLLAILFFLWGVLNTTDGITEGNLLNLGKGVIVLVIAAYYAYPGNKVILRYKVD
jgi:hypothetical protein